MVNLLTILVFLAAFTLGGTAIYFAVVSDQQISLDRLFGQTDTPPTPSSKTLPTSVVLIAAPELSLTPTPIVSEPTIPQVSATPEELATSDGSTLLATWTPIPELSTSTPRPTNTRGPTRTPSPIPTFPTKTPTRTATPTPTLTPTLTPTGPTITPAPTRSAFPFTKSDISPFYLQNFSNNAGCSWSGIAGSVFGLDGNPTQIGRYRVHIWGDGFGDKYVTAGSAPIYSDSGWELFLFDTPTVREYNIQLESENGTAVSQLYRIQTRASCDQNLLRIDFVQNH